MIYNVTYIYIFVKKTHIYIIVYIYIYLFMFIYIYMGDSIVALYILFVGCIWFLFGLCLGDKKTLTDWDAHPMNKINPVPQRGELNGIVLGSITANTWILN